MESFDSHGELYVLFGRVIPGVRSLISIPAGFKGMQFKKFLVYTILGTIAWNLLLGSAGYVLGRNWERVLEVLSTYETIVYIAIAVLVLGFVSYRIYNRRKDD
jgi:membrane protein DedA with SNARE-associated domain